MSRLAAPRRVHFLILAAGWMTFTVYGSLAPFQYVDVPFEEAVARVHNLPSPTFAPGTRADWIANILLFVPLTFLWMAVVSCDRGWATRVAAALVIIPLAATAAMALEFTQTWFDGRNVSTNDVVAETFGGALGVVGWLGAGQRVVNRLRTYDSPTERRWNRLDWLLGAYVICIVIYSVMPLDLTISVTELYHKYRRGQVVLVPFSLPTGNMGTWAIQLTAFVPVGIWLVPRMESWRRARLREGAAAAGTALASAIEFTQLLNLNQVADATDVVLGTAGSAIGAWLITRDSNRGQGT